MEFIEEHLDRGWYRTKGFAEYFNGLRPVVFDIETTGLASKFSHMILGGTLEPTADGLVLRQYFAENRQEEEALLLMFCDALSSADVLISYNGNSFDLPFLTQRLSVYGHRAVFPTLQTFDLYRIVRYYSSLGTVLPNLKQKSLETFLGTSEDRFDEISGLESARLFSEYEIDRDPEKKKRILLHNRDDLVQLSSILTILDKLDLHRILHHEGFTVSLGDLRVVIQKISFGKKSMTISATTRGITTDYYSFTSAYQAVHKVSEQSLSLEIPFERHEDAIYIDMKNVLNEAGSLSDSANVVNDYLILQKGKNIHYKEVNAFIKHLLTEFLGFFDPLLDESRNV